MAGNVTDTAHAIAKLKTGYVTLSLGSYLAPANNNKKVGGEADIDSHMLLWHDAYALH